VRPIIGISVGHYGPAVAFEGMDRADVCTSHLDRDEWTYSRNDMVSLIRKFGMGGLVYPEPVCIDARHIDWRAVSRVHGFVGNYDIRLRAQMAKLKECDLLIELHYNYYSDHAVSGHEAHVFGGEDKSAEWAEMILGEMDGAFPEHRNRGVKESEFKILQLMQGAMPTVLMEPAFIFEDILEDTEAWRERYTTALVAATYRFLDLDSPRS